MKAFSVVLAAIGVFAMVGCAAGAGEEATETPTSGADEVVVEVETDKVTPACNQKAGCGGPVYCLNPSSCPDGQVCRDFQPWYAGYYIGTCQPY